MNNQIKAVIFDMDGVIVDTEPLAALHLEKRLRKLGAKNIDMRQLTPRLKGKNTRDNWHILRNEYNLDGDIDQLAADHRQSLMKYWRSLEKIPEIPGVTSLIEQLYAHHYALALASASHMERIELFLVPLKLQKYFSVIVNGDEVQRSKPDPEIFLLAAKRLGVEPGECVVIEDATNGVRGAKAAGMICIAYGGSDHNTDDLSAADLVVQDFSEVSRSLAAGTFPAL